MRNCPLCGKKVEMRMPFLVKISDDNWSFMHHCSMKACIFITAKSQEEILEIWEGNHGEEHSAEA